MMVKRTVGCQLCPDFIFTRMFYVIFKIVEAFVLAVPIILLSSSLNVVAQILVLTMILTLFQ